MFWSCLRYRFPYFYFFLLFLVLCFPFPQSILPPFHSPNLPPIVFPLKITFSLLVFLINSSRRILKKKSLCFLWDTIHHQWWIFTNTLARKNSGGKCLLLQVSALRLPASETWLWEWFSPTLAALLWMCTCRRKHSFGFAFFLPQPPSHQSTEMAGCREGSRLKDTWTRRKQRDWDTGAPYLGYLSLHSPLVKRVILSTQCCKAGV